MSTPFDKKLPLADAGSPVQLPSQEVAVAEDPRNGGIEFYGGYQVYSETGVDLTLLRENLKRTVTQRWENHRGALHFANALQDAGRAKRAPNSNIVGSQIIMLQEEPILRQLAAHQVEYVLIGGLAMRTHGSAYITEDLDICYSRTPNNIAAVVAAITPLHPYLRGVPPGLPFRFDAPTIQAGLNFTFTSDLGYIDLLGEVSGIGRYEQALAQSQELTIYGLNVRVLSIDGLIAAKKAAGRVKDRLHLLELEELKKMRDAGQGETPP